jgi:hypothetical protein
MRYVEFTQRQDVEMLLNCMVHAIFADNVIASATRGGHSYPHWLWDRQCGDCQLGNLCFGLNEVFLRNPGDF